MPKSLSEFQCCGDCGTTVVDLDAHQANCQDDAYATGADPDGSDLTLADVDGDVLATSRWAATGVVHLPADDYGGTDDADGDTEAGRDAGVGLDHDHGDGPEPVCRNRNATRTRYRPSGWHRVPVASLDDHRLCQRCAEQHDRGDA